MGQAAVKGMGKIAMATGLLDPNKVKNEFVTQINRWAPYDFVQYCQDKEGAGTWDPKEGETKSPPDGWKGKYYLDEDQACKFVKHLINKWKGRNKCIIERHGAKLSMIDLNEFGGCLKSALKENDFTAPFTDKNYNLNGSWDNIFNVVSYNDAECRKCFKKMCDADGKLYYGTLDDKVVKPLAGSIGRAVEKLFG